MFTLRKKGCPTCKPLVFASPNVTANFIGLEPGATYNVTVAGIARDGTRTPGDNWLPLVMPTGLLLTKAKATGYTTGVATARALPEGAFTKVCASHRPRSGTQTRVPGALVSPWLAF